MYTKDPKELVIQYGSNLLKPAHPKLENVAEIYRHEGYSYTIAIHDIAVMKLKKRLLLKSTDVVKLTGETTCKKFVGNKMSLLLVGWGLNATNGALQEQLQKVALNLLPSTECRQQTQSTLHNSNLCAGAVNGSRQGQCSGDSGGPLLFGKQQIGIVSWSLKPCGAYPGIFTNVGCYTEWIREHINSKR